MKLLKRAVPAILVICLLAAILQSCGNKQIFDTNYTFDRALIAWPDGTMKTIDLKSWTDYEDGEQLQLIDTNGNVYLVSSINCVLIKSAD